MGVMTFTAILLLGFFWVLAPQTFAGKGDKGKDNYAEWQKHKKQDKDYQKHRKGMNREDRKHFDQQGRHDYRKRSDYHHHRGYRDRPYDKHRHYKHHDFNGRRYDYHGHWRSWEQWDRYARKHPKLYKYGEYYRENAHLMFRFYEPGTGNCFFFSIGR